MPNEATPVAAEVTSAAPAQTEPAAEVSAKVETQPEIATQAGRTIGERPAPFRAKGLADAMARAQAAIQARAQSAKAETPKEAANAQQGEAGKAPEASQTKVEPTKTDAPKVEATEAKPDEATAKKEAAKQERISRGLALIAEREQKVLESEKRVKAMLADLERKQSAASDDPYVKLGRQLREVQAKEGPAGVLKALGIDLRAGVEELAKTYEDPTPESIARKVAAEEFERRQKEAADREAATKRETDEKENARLQVMRQEMADDVTTEFRRAVDDFPFVASHDVSADEVVNYAGLMERQTGKRPTAIEALRAVEQKLVERAKAAQDRISAKAKAAEATQKAQEPAKPAPPPSKAEAKTETPKQEEKPAEQQRRKESVVKPLVQRIQRNIPAHERAQRALANRGLT